MKNVLITGISGFIGRYLYNYRPQNVAVSGTYFQNQPDFQDITLKKLDLLNVNSFVKSEKSCDVMIHTAAQSNLSVCEKDKTLTNQINTESTKILCDWSEQNNSRFIFLSTDIVFDGEKGNYTESDKAEPVNFYGRSKLDAENYIRQISSNYVIARIALCLGRGLAGTKNLSEIL